MICFCFYYKYNYILQGVNYDSVLVFQTGGSPNIYFHRNNGIIRFDGKNYFDFQLINKIKK